MSDAWHAEQAEALVREYQVRDAALRADLERVTRERFAAQDQLELTRTERDGWRNTHAAISALSLRYYDENVALRARLAEAETQRDACERLTRSTEVVLANVEKQRQVGERLLAEVEPEIATNRDLARRVAAFLANRMEDHQ